MKTMTYTVQNLKCQGCSNRIKEKLSQIPGIQNVALNIDDDQVTFSYNSFGIPEKVQRILKSLGYPLMDEHNSLTDKAASYVSCMIGRTKS